MCAYVHVYEFVHVYVYTLVCVVNLEDSRWSINSILLMYLYIFHVLHCMCHACCMCVQTCNGPHPYSDLVPMKYILKPFLL